MTLEEIVRERLGDDAPAVLARIAAWSTSPAFSSWHPLLEAMVSGPFLDELVDAFSRVLPFGTGGRRGAAGVGTNRFNPWTLGTSVQGHCAFLKKRFDGDISVVVTYDVRAFHDTNGRYPEGVPSPLDGMTSRTLAELAARIYAANGIKAWIQDRGDDTFLSTPELSFLIRELGAQGGLNVSASHNPPDDNGGKIYDEHGGQLVPPDDQELLDTVVGFETYEALSWDEARPSFGILTADHHKAYVDAVVAGAPEVDPISVAATSLHGAGRIHEILGAAGFPTAVIADQARPDGLFPTVPGKVANPEIPEVFQVGMEALEGLDTQLLFATDPDADRIGCMVRHEDEWVFLTGNQIAALVIDARLRRWSSELRPLVVHTEVSSRLLTRVAESYSAEVRNDLLVGFKYIAAVMNEAEPGRFAVGAEESHGLLTSERMRDKDAGGGALWLAIAASDAAEEGLTLVDRLVAFDVDFGPVRNTQVSKKFEGLKGRADMAELLERLRATPPRTFAGRKVTAFVDHQDPEGPRGPILSESDAAARNVLAMELEGGARVVFRPSGTEPKLKVYLEVAGSPGQSGVDDVLAGLVTAVKTQLA
ncbi:MAG: phospho-sugar mutase [Alphaproteobacteria bacterium]|nr:phospho-sugar mutase [Alphaproteobacteria bacterium]MCB9691638.1 phospho-sugar mutase [Alphaproteobacteria bacterium]